MSMPAASTTRCEMDPSRTQVCTVPSAEPTTAAIDLPWACSLPWPPRRPVTKPGFSPEGFDCCEVLLRAGLGRTEGGQEVREHKPQAVQLAGEHGKLRRQIEAELAAQVAFAHGEVDLPQ